jgi:hypothetical protein
MNEREQKILDMAVMLLTMAPTTEKQATDILQKIYELGHSQGKVDALKELSAPA